MSLDNTLDSGRPGLDELVPSRYALQVGDIDVMVISDGVLPIAGHSGRDKPPRPETISTSPAPCKH